MDTNVNYVAKHTHMMGSSTYESVSAVHEMLYPLSLALSVVVLFFISIVVFPTGIKNLARHPQLCGSNAGSFTLGHCSIGWAYILTMVGTGTGAVAAGLSWTPGKWKERHRRGGYTL